MILRHRIKIYVPGCLGFESRWAGCGQIRSESLEGEAPCNQGPPAPRALCRASHADRKDSSESKKTKKNEHHAQQSNKN